MVGQERVVADGRRAAALGQAEHDDEVEVEADAHADGPTSTPSPKRPEPAQVGVELEGEGAAEDVEADGALDGAEGGQPVERRLDPLGGAPARSSGQRSLGRRPAEEAPR